MATWGHQVVVPGTKAGTTELPNEDLGLALLGRNDRLATQKQDAANYLFPLILTNNSAEWYTAAMWDQENTEALTGSVVPNAPRATRERFAKLVYETSVRLADPAQISVGQAGHPLGPPANQSPTQRRTYAQDG